MVFIYGPPYGSMEGFTGCCFFSLSDYKYLSDGGSDWHEILHDGAHRSRTDLLPFAEDLGILQDPQVRNFGPKLWPFDRKYLENGKLQCYMSIRA